MDFTMPLICKILADSNLSVTLKLYGVAKFAFSYICYTTQA